MLKLSKQFFKQNGLILRQLVALKTSSAQLQRRNYSNPSYEGDGKINCKVLNNDLEMGLMVNSYSQIGFRLNNKVSIIGPICIFPRTVLSWNVESVDDIDEHSLRLLLALEPKLELLIIGTGDTEVKPELYHRIQKITKTHDIRVEILKTESAVTTFNFMNAESRFVAAAMIPPKKIVFNDMGLLTAAQRQKELYGPDLIDLEQPSNPKISS